MKKRSLPPVLVAALVALGAGLCASFLCERWTIPSEPVALAASIEPTLRARDRVVVSTYTQIARGDLVRCAHPGGGGGFVIGRVLGEHGDYVQIAGAVLKNGPEVYSSEDPCDDRGASTEKHELDCVVEDIEGHHHQALRGTKAVYPAVNVDQGKIYLVSDNRLGHYDAREYGQVDRATCARIFLLLEGEPRGTEKSRGLAWLQ